MFTVSLATTVALLLASQFGLVIGAVAGIILALLGALMGLGWGTRKFMSKVSGRKF